ENQNERDRGYLARLKAISVAGFPEQDRLSHEVLARTLEQRIADYDLKEDEMPVNQMDGPQTHLADLPLAVPLDSVKHYEDYVARLHQIPRVFMQTEEVLRAGKKFPSSIPAEEQPRLRKEITEAVVKDVLPAYVGFANFIAADYAPFGRTTLAVASLPGGKQRYLNDIRARTTLSNLTPDQIHQIGLREIKRIEAEM